MSKQAAPNRNQRSIALLGVAICNDIDSDDLDAACKSAGIDPYAADLAAVDAAVKASYGTPPPSSWLPWRRG